MKDYSDAGGIGPHEIWILIFSLIAIVLGIIEIFDKEVFDV